MDKDWKDEDIDFEGMEELYRMLMEKQNNGLLPVREMLELKKVQSIGQGKNGSNRKRRNWGSMP